jgi:hypothetical protein
VNALLLATSELCFGRAALVNKCAPKAKSRRSTLAKAQFNQATLAGKHLADSSRLAGRRCLPLEPDDRQSRSGVPETCFQKEAAFFQSRRIPQSLRGAVWPSLNH